MKIFQTVQNNLILLGYIRNHDGYRYYLFRRSHLVAIAILMFTLSLTSLFTFATFLADSPAEYMDSFYIIAVVLSMFVSYLNTILNMSKFFDFIDNCEKVCNESKFRFSLNFKIFEFTVVNCLYSI